MKNPMSEDIDTKIANIFWVVLFRLFFVILSLPIFLECLYPQINIKIYTAIVIIIYILCESTFKFFKYSENTLYFHDRYYPPPIYVLLFSYGLLYYILHIYPTRFFRILLRTKKSQYYNINL